MLYTRPAVTVGVHWKALHRWPCANPNTNPNSTAGRVYRHFDLQKATEEWLTLLP